METFSMLLAPCSGNSPVTGEFPAQRPVTRSFDVFFDLRLNKRYSKQSWGWWFETPSCSLWRHCNVELAFIVMMVAVVLLSNRPPAINNWHHGILVDDNLGRFNYLSRTKYPDIRTVYLTELDVDSNFARKMIKYKFQCRLHAKLIKYEIGHRSISLFWQIWEEQFLSYWNQGLFPDLRPMVKTKEFKF